MTLEKSTSTSAQEITLRVITQEDAESLFDLLEATRHCLGYRGFWKSEDFPSEESVLETIRASEKPGFLWYGIWFVDQHLPSDDEVLIGSITISSVSCTEKDIEFWIGFDYQGRDLGKRALDSLLALMWGTLPAGTTSFDPEPDDYDLPFRMKILTSHS